MADTIRYIDNAAGDHVYPVTHERGVLDDNGQSIETKLQHEADIDDALVTKTTYVTADLLAMDTNDYTINGSTGNWGTSSSSKHLRIDINPGDYVYVTSNSSNGTGVAFLKSRASATSGGTPAYAGDATNRTSLPVGKTVRLIPPADAVIMYVYMGTAGSSTYLPNSIVIRKVATGRSDAPLPSFSILGTGNAIAYSPTDMTQFQPGRKYRFTVIGWAIDEVTSGSSYTMFQISSYDANGEVTYLIRQYMGEVRSDYYDIVVPNDSVRLEFGIRANNGTKVTIISEDITTYSELAESFVDSTEEHLSFNMIDFTNLVGGTYINSSGGVSTVSDTKYRATNFIPLNGKKVYYGVGMGSHGSATNGAAVYDANKNFIRAFRPSASGSYDPVSADEGAAFIRLTLTGSYTMYYVVYADADGNNPFSVASGIVTSDVNYFRDQIIKKSEPGLVYPKEVIPEVIPAFSMAGQNGILKQYASIAASGYEAIASSEYPSYLKSCHTISIKASMESFGDSDYVLFGVNRNNSRGKTVRINSDSVAIQRYDSGYLSNISFQHGLTISDFIMCEVNFTWYGGKLRLVSRDGAFVQEWQNSQYSYTGNAQVNYGRAFIETSVAITDVKLAQCSDRFRKPVWVIGDSYTSMASARWTWQMVNNFGIDGFLIDGYAGAPSENMGPELERLLQFGTPKYLLWCLGMNDTAPVWLNTAKKVEMLCRDRGITLVYTTIPKNNSNKNEINLYIRNSGYRYIDFVSAVMPNGTWYPDMDDDGTHPTVLGAKVLAGQVLVDFPEITY